MPAKKHWTKEAILESASQYETVAEWKSNCPTYRVAASKYGWYDLATAHMKKVYGSAPGRNINLINMSGRTREEVMASSARYTSASEWKANEPYIYACNEAERLRAEGLVHRRYWNKEVALLNAKSFSNFDLWKKAHPGAYKLIDNLGLLNEATAHMET